MTPENCRDCIMGRREYGYDRCPVHYDPVRDAYRAEHSLANDVYQCWEEHTRGKYAGCTPPHFHEKRANKN